MVAQFARNQSVTRQIPESGVTVSLATAEIDDRPVAAVNWTTSKSFASPRLYSPQGPTIIVAHPDNLF